MDNIKTKNNDQMYVYKNLFIVERKKNNALTQRILKRYKASWGVLEPFTYSSGEDMIILCFTSKVHMSKIANPNCRYELVCKMKLLCSKGIFKVEEFNTNLREFVPFTMTTLKIMLFKLYKNPQVVWDKNIESFIILEAHKKGLLYNFSEHVDVIKKRPMPNVIPNVMSNVIPNVMPNVIPNVIPNVMPNVIPNNVVLAKLTTKVIGKPRPPPPRYLTWDRLVYVKQ